MNLIRVQYDQIVDAWNSCARCPISEHAHTHVFGKGSLQPQVIFIGEGPGKTEDLDGMPFTGVSGQLLDKAIKMAGRSSDSPQDTYPVRVFFTNLVACRPCDRLGGGNRAPSETEIKNCSDRLRETVDLLKPKVVCLLGAVPRKALEDVFWLKGKKVICLPHPAWVLRQGGFSGACFQAYVERMKEVVRCALA